MSTKKRSHFEPLMFADSNRNADIRWFTRFDCCDPFLAFGHKGKRLALTHSLEYGRMNEEGRLDKVLLWDAVVKEVKAATGMRKPRLADLIRHLQKQRHIPGFTVPRDFPIWLHEALRKQRVRLRTAKGEMFPKRAIKAKDEVEMLRESNRVTGLAHREVARILKASRIDSRGGVRYEGKPLTSEKLRAAIDQTCLANGGIPVLAHIAAVGDQSVDCHFVGAGPIKAGELIVVDIFPRMAKSGYFGDITRTYLKGKASPEQKRLYRTVRKGQQLAMAAMKAGVATRVPYKATLDYFIAQGYKPKNTNGKFEGFRHGLGHGLGLDVHEAPNMGRVPAGKLKAGQVVTVEPGLYYLGIGGVRIEDVVLVTKTGVELLSKVPYTWEIA